MPARCLGENQTGHRRRHSRAKCMQSGFLGESYSAQESS
jgi:hypothetical protein